MIKCTEREWRVTWGKAYGKMCEHKIAAVYLCGYDHGRMNCGDRVSSVAPLPEESNDRSYADTWRRFMESTSPQRSQGAVTVVVKYLRNSTSSRVQREVS